MASKTTNYGLNKHSPQDFYNVEARNENWDKIDEALAAADPTKITAKAEPADGDGVMIADSADGGKAKRLLWSNVKATLGKLFVPLARKINGKALSADVTLTGDDIAMGADDAETLRAAMAKRLMANGNVMRQGFIGSTVDDMYFASVTGTQNGGFLECYKDYARRTQFVISPPSDNTPISARIARTDDGTHWTSKFLATCETPEVHELPLASGFPTQSYANTYYKTQEGIVHLNFCVTRGSSTAFTASEVVCTLPVGYRPSSVRMFSVGGDSGYFGTVAAPVQVYVTSDGELKFISCAQKVTWIYGEITYLAG